MQLKYNSINKLDGGRRILCGKRQMKSYEANVQSRASGIFFNDVNEGYNCLKIADKKGPLTIFLLWLLNA